MTLQDLARRASSTAPLSSGDPYKNGGFGEGLPLRNRILAAIRAGGPGTLTWIAQHIGSTYAAVAQAVEPMVKRGEVEPIGKQRIRNGVATRTATVYGLPGMEAPEPPDEDDPIFDRNPVETLSMARAFAEAMGGLRY